MLRNVISNVPRFLWCLRCKDTVLFYSCYHAVLFSLSLIRALHIFILFLFWNFLSFRNSYFQLTVHSRIQSDTKVESTNSGTAFYYGKKKKEKDRVKMSDGTLSFVAKSQVRSFEVSPMTSLFC